MRWNLHASDCASACPSVVLPTPGTSSIRRWPSASKATIARSIVCCFPFMVFSLASRRAETFEAILSHVRIGPIGIPVIVRHAINRCHDAGSMTSTLAMDEHGLIRRIVHKLQELGDRVAGGPV